MWQHKKTIAQVGIPYLVGTFTHFARKFSRATRVQERALLGLHICLWEYTEKLILKSIFPLKVPATLLISSRKGAVSWCYMLTLQDLTYIEGNNQPTSPCVTMPQEPWDPIIPETPETRYLTQLRGSAHPCKL